MKQFILALLLCLAPVAQTAEAVTPVAVAPEAPFSPIPRGILRAHYRVMVYDGWKVMGAGTGIAIDARTILTAGHVAEGAKGETYRVDIFDDTWKYLKSLALKLKKTNGNADAKPATDLAVLTTDEDLPFFHKIEAGEIKEGDQLYNVGGPFGSEPYHVSFGIFRTKNVDGYPGLWEANVLAAPGNSGGGVFTVTNKFIGILVRGGEEKILFVPAATVLEFLK